VALRTAVASVLTGVMLPWALSAGPRRDRDRLGFYRDLAATRDPDTAFPAPPPGVEVSSAGSGGLESRRRAARVDLLRFESPFVAANPAVREEYARFARNGTAWAQHWRHADGPRPTLCVIHGFGASPYWFNRAFFALPSFFHHGYDILLYTLPFHGPRRSKLAPVNGAELFGSGLAHLNEGIGQGVHDFRVLIDYLQASGVERIAVTGLSLGGYVSALLAAVEDRLDLVIPIAPVVSMVPLMRQWFPASLLFAAVSRAHGISPQDAESALAVHCPLTYEPVVPNERLMIIGGLGDRLAPPEQAQMLWEHWGRPRLHWFSGSHMVHASRAAYLREIRGFMQATGFTHA